MASFPGVAFRVVGHAEKWNEKYQTTDIDPDWVDAVMVGDDHKHRIEASELTVIGEDEYCHQCGQTGCTHDGRPAE